MVAFCHTAICKNAYKYKKCSQLKFITALDNTQSGSIDDIRIWNSVLTPSDISGL